MNKRALQQIRKQYDRAIGVRDFGETEAAVQLALIALAAAARIRYPKPTSDRMAFTSYICDEIPGWNGSFIFREEPTDLPTILYKFVRCEYVHEAGLPVDINFTDRQDTTMVIGGGAIELGRGWLDRMLYAISHDRALYPVFSDLVAPPVPILMSQSPGGMDSLRNELCEKWGLSLGRLDTFERLLWGIGWSIVWQSNRDTIAYLWAMFSKDAFKRFVPRGEMYALNSTPTDGIPLILEERGNSLSESGFSVIERYRDEVSLITTLIVERKLTQATNPQSR
ncbi:hypothetical protein [Sphingomonas parapaucimobilis]|uniref:hypothetical protein n=1 Tax=Sphingomonas parapaucimobilis TaxID=28213 RepID=UPI0035C7B6B1